MSRIKAILFDMDGVLIDAREWHYHSLNKALQLFGKTITRDDHLDNFNGLPTKEKLEKLSLNRGLPRELHGLIEDLKQKHTRYFIHKYCNPNFHHEYTLSKLKSEGYKLALCSNSIRNSVNLMMELSNLRQYFDITFSNEDVTRPKPDPQIYQLAMEKLGSSPDQCLVVEDNVIGIQSATDAGAFVLRVQSPLEVTYDTVKKAIKNVESFSSKKAKGIIDGIEYAYTGGWPR